MTYLIRLKTMHQTYKGSITVFAVLSLMVMLSTILAFLEVTRYQTYKEMLQLTSDSVTESLFAGYQRELWDSYHLLGMEAAEQNGEISFIYQEALAKNYAKSIEEDGQVYVAKLKQSNMKSFDLITDKDGMVYERAVAQMVRHMTGLTFLEDFMSDFDFFSENQLEMDQGNSIVKEAENAIKEGFENQKSAENLDEWNKKEAIEGTPFEIAEEMSEVEKKAGLLSLLVEDTSQLSKKTIVGTDLLSSRNRFEGNGKLSIGEEREGVFTDRILMNLYHMKTFEHYKADKGMLGTDVDGDTLEEAPNSKTSNSKTLNSKDFDYKILDYELEYLLHGKDSDIENLKATCQNLFSAREALNYAYLQTDEVKKAEALAMAELIGGASLNPLLVEAIKQGILFSWATVESLLDMRTLLAGRKIALFKNADNWTSSLENLAEFKEGFVMAKESEAGINYEGYLTFLLLMQSRGDSAYRAMDLMEGYIRNSTGRMDFRMDTIIVQAEIEYSYAFSHAFFALDMDYQLCNQTGYSYLQKIG